MISSEFSKYATSYETNNTIQNRVVEQLLLYNKTKSQNILDLGCGSGAVCKAIKWKYNHFLGVDFAQGMLEIHPKANNIELLYGDFNTKELFEKLYHQPFDVIFSSSALQWAKDIKIVLEEISRFQVPVSLAIFTSNTFKTLHQTADISSLLEKKEKIKELKEEIFPNARFEVIEYRLEFDSTREMFRYIKQSGVSGSRKLLSYKQTKKLMKSYPLNYLEFEVAFISSY
jgi:malonyl-CoA O-methyltransferase